MGAVSRSVDNFPWGLIGFHETVFHIPLKKSVDIPAVKIIKLLCVCVAVNGIIAVNSKGLIAVITFVKGIDPDNVHIRINRFEGCRFRLQILHCCVSEIGLQASIFSHPPGRGASRGDACRFT